MSSSSSSIPKDGSINAEAGPKNYSFHAIAGAYALAFPPYLYQFTRMMTASKFQATNILPRTNLDTLKGTIPEATWNSLVRARGAHLNAFEGFPFFAAAMLAGNYVNLPTRDLNIAAAEYLGARVAYNLLYMTVRSEAASYLRSAAYAWSIAVPFYVLWQAGKKINQKSEKVI